MPQAWSQRNPNDDWGLKIVPTLPKPDHWISLSFPWKVPFLLHSHFWFCRLERNPFSFLSFTDLVLPKGIYALLLLLILVEMVTISSSITAWISDLFACMGWALDFRNWYLMKIAIYCFNHFPFLGVALLYWVWWLSLTTCFLKWKTWHDAE